MPYLSEDALQEIANRQARAGRLLEWLDVSPGLDWEAFQAHPDVADLCLDFVTLSHLYDLYRGTPSDSTERAARLLGDLPPGGLGTVINIRSVSHLKGRP